MWQRKKIWVKVQADLVVDPKALPEVPKAHPEALEVHLLEAEDKEMREVGQVQVEILPEADVVMPSCLHIDPDDEDNYDDDDWDYGYDL
tara:strand:- start:2528 stop:2794 length:267 start_codon:yes stop_codon:yes gene_type:complete